MLLIIKVIMPMTILLKNVKKLLPFFSVRHAITLSRFPVILRLLIVPHYVIHVLIALFHLIVGPVLIVNKRKDNQCIF